jgi:fructokinase
MRIGIDLGGTKIEGIVIDSGGREVARRRVPTPPGYGESLEALAALVAGLEADAGAPAMVVGVGMPGSISPATGLARNGNSTWLNGRPFDRDLAARLGKAVRAANDANCFTLSEATDGAAAGAATVFGVILGTGCGGGVCIDGNVLNGASGIAGEWGHNPLPWPAPDELEIAPCWCGKRGCLETWLSGPALAADHQRSGGARLRATEIAAQAVAGDTLAAASLARWSDRLARGLATIINTIDPDVIVFGGGLSNIDALYTDVPPLLGRYVFSDFVAATLLRNAHGDSSGVRGAAWLWRPEELA